MGTRSSGINPEISSARTLSALSMGHKVVLLMFAALVAMRSHNSLALVFIFITLLIDVTGMGIIIPVLPRLISELIQGDIGEASQWGGWLHFVFAFMMFLFAPVLGNLSDWYGRRPVLLLALVGSGLDYLLLSVAPTIWWLVVGRLVAGIMGASFTTATAYIADVSSPADRTKNFGLIGAAFGLGFILGPVAGGLLGSLGPRVPFVAAAVLSLANAVLGYFVLPESLSAENRRKFEWKRANPMGALIHIKKYPAIGPLAFCLFLLYLGGQSLQSTWTFFTIQSFNWSEQMIGYSLGVVGLLIGLVQGVFIRRINPWLGNERSIVVGLMIYAVGLTLFSLATEGWMMFAISFVYCMGGIAAPALQSMMTSQVPANAQGELQGGITALISISAIIGPPMMTQLFFYFTRPENPISFPGAPFFTGALLMLSAGLVVMYKFRNK